MSRFIVKKVIALGAVLGVVVAIAPSAIASNPHFVNTPTCSLTNGGTTVTCTGGKIAGVGTEPTFVGIDVAAGCATSGNGNEPKGHKQAVTGPITPKGGNITFGSLSVSADCPPGLNPVFGTTVQYFIVQNGVRTNVGEPIPIT
jgi:hypothetical protein